MSYVITASRNKILSIVDLGLCYKGASSRYLNSMMAEKSVHLTLPFPTPESAALAYEVLCVDKEVKRSEVRREITSEGTNLEITFHGAELKKLRVALNGVLKNILLIAKTIDQFKS